MNDGRLYQVMLDENGVTCVDPAGVSASVAWAEVTAVAIVTHPVSTSGIEYWIELRSSTGTCRVPQLAQGEKELLFDGCKAHFPDMDFRAISQAMTSVKDAVFTVWPRTE
jgi:hypothetical protein